MDPKPHIDKLKAARALVAEVRAATGLPQIESILDDADMNLHWALWNLGEIETLRPDMKV